MMPEPEISIQRVIVHKVDHKNYDEPLLSDLASPYSNEVASFLRQHIRRNREHKNSRTARFLADIPPDTPSLQDMADTLLDDAEQFVPESRKIAEHLFDSLDQRTSPGDLVVCMFVEDGNEAPQLALLKMDPSDGFIGEREEIDGQIRVVLRRVPNVLPRGELQKCAFILPVALRKAKKHHLVVLDQQAARYGTRRPIATFFSRDFLQCTVNLNREDRTIIFVDGSRQWLNQRASEWTEQDIRQFHQQLDTTLANQTIDVDAFANSVIPELEDQQAYIEYLKEFGLDDLTFEPDPERRKRLVKYAQFEGDDGLRIRIKADAVGAKGEGKTLEYHKDPATNDWIVQIRTNVWRQK